MRGDGTRVALRHREVHPEPRAEERSVSEHNEPPWEGGSQPVDEHPREVPKGGRSVMQTVVVVLGVLVVLAALLWLVVPLGGAD